jgi:alpha-amylase/alpha-mannosidase (GH57 family)
MSKGPTAGGRHLDLVLLWHMHQPDFREQTSGEYLKPWVYLHALKDYSDMAAHLESHPGVKTVVNLVPILVDQLEDYAAQFDGGQVDDGHLASGRLRDPLLRMLARENLDGLDRRERELLLDQCFRANHVKMIEPYASYKRLRDLYEFTVAQGADHTRYLSGQYLADLVTWYHLSWTGETVRRAHEPIARLMGRGEGFTHAERLELLQIVGRVTRDILTRYRRLAEAGRVELSTTPYHHPIGPLLLEFGSARERMPDAPFPRADSYPGGRTRLCWHLTRAQEAHARRFGAPAKGIWPAEGAISLPFCRLLGEQGAAWTASGEGVLAASLHKSGLPAGERVNYLYRPYRVGGGESGVTCFFRDDRLSDLIGFEYKTWHGSDAARHFVQQLEQILEQAPAGPAPVVSVILDGENAWEFYPYNGFYFLNELYAALEKHPSIRTRTFAEVAADPARVPAPLPEIATGSWVYGNLATWIGSEDKNRAWDLLVSAKQSYDLVLASGRLSAAEADAAARQLAVCEGSDWFWWFGDYNPRDSVRSFDALFRAYLTSLYRLLKLEPPPQLDEPVSLGAARAHTDGAMRRAA